jgi:hypothetical protein
VSALEGTTTLPVVGTTKRSYVAVGVALVAGIAGWAWYKRVNGSDTSGDPASYYADTRTGSEVPNDAYVNPAPNADGQSGTGIGGDSVFHAPNTDPEWAQATVDKLSWYEPGYVSATVGKYLARQPLTADEQTLIREAWAQLGHPPGNQPILASATGTGTGTSNPPRVALPAGQGWTRVKPGDSIAGIAKRTGITVAKLYALNRLTPGEWVRVRGLAGPRPPK